MDFELLIILLIDVTTYVVMPAYTSFRDFLASTTQPDNLFCYGKTVYAWFWTHDGHVVRWDHANSTFLKSYIPKESWTPVYIWILMDSSIFRYSWILVSFGIHESLNIHDFFKIHKSFDIMNLLGFTNWDSRFVLLITEDSFKWISTKDAWNSTLFRTIQ